MRNRCNIRSDVAKTKPGRGHVPGQNIALSGHAMLVSTSLLNNPSVLPREEAPPGNQICKMVLHRLEWLGNW